MDMNFELRMISGPLVGAVIGYCTNYIAVKMLFRPLKAVKIGNYTLPFTPGIIPKGKKRLAKALGNAIGSTLLTKDDMMNALLTESMKKQVADGIVGGILSVPSIKELAGSFVEEEKYLEVRGNLTTAVENKILDAIKEAEIGKIVVEEGIKAIKERLSGGLLGMFVTDDLIASVAEPIKENIERYIDENGPLMVSNIVERETINLEMIPLGQAVSENVEREKLYEAVEKVYINVVEQQIGKIIDQINIAGLVERKINDMDVLEVERLTISIMKKELDAVVNLGALIGFVIGIINVFV